MSEVVMEQREDEVWNVLSLLAQSQDEPLVDDEDEAFEFMADEVTGQLGDEAQKHPILAQLMAAPPDPEKPFDERKNVIALREAYEGAMEDSLTAQQFRTKMEPLYQLAMVAVEIFKNPRIKREADVLPDDQLAIVNRAKTQLARLKSGVDTMWKHWSRPDKETLQRGFLEAESAMREIWNVQMAAHRKAQEIDREFAGSLSEEQRLSRATDSYQMAA